MLLIKTVIFYLLLTELRLMLRLIALSSPHRLLQLHSEHLRMNFQPLLGEAAFKVFPAVSVCCCAFHTRKSSEEL